MKYLFIDSATANLVVAIIIDMKIKYIFNQNTEKNMSTILMPTIEEAFKKSNIRPNDLDKIFVVNGPGSFTGIRVGLTVAKIMAWALKIPIVPISSLEVISSGETKETMAIIDARRGYVYAGAYDKNLKNIFEDKYILFEKLNSTHFVSYDELSNNKPKIDILKIVKKHEKEKGVNPHNLNPKYLKLTEAEEKKKKND